MAGPQASARAQALAAVGGALLVFALVQLFVDTERTAAPGGRPEREEVEKWYKGDDVHGSCALGDYIRLMPCKSNVDGAACCAGLKGIFDHKCACRPIPGIVSGHGGNFISFVQNYVRCNFTEGDMAPIDYVTEAHPCIDQKEWCNNGIHNVDVRLTTYETGHIQIWDKHEGWVFVSPKSVDETHLRNLGATVCRALNFEEVRTINGHHGEPDYPAVYLDKYRTPKKLVKCSAESVSAKSMSACEVVDCEGDACSAGTVSITCHKGGAPQLCGRATMSKATNNHLKCRNGDDDGYELDDHERHVGAAHMVCGTRGLNESRVEWFDGFQDDFTTYEAQRDHKTGLLKGYRKWHGKVKGEDLLTHDEYKKQKEVRKQLKEQAQQAHDYAQEQHDLIEQAMLSENKTFEEVYHERFEAILSKIGAFGKRRLR